MVRFPSPSIDVYRTTAQVADGPDRLDPVEASNKVSGLELGSTTTRATCIRPCCVMSRRPHSRITWNNLDANVRSHTMPHHSTTCHTIEHHSGTRTRSGNIESATQCQKTKFCAVEQDARFQTADRCMLFNLSWKVGV